MRLIAPKGGLLAPRILYAPDLPNFYGDGTQHAGRSIFDLLLKMQAQGQITIRSVRADQRIFEVSTRCGQLFAIEPDLPR